MLLAHFSYTDDHVFYLSGLRPYPKAAQGHQQGK